MKYLSFIFLFFFAAFSSQVTASVVMTGTRIIFPSTAAEKTIQFKNVDSEPFVVQLQMTEEKGMVDDSAPFAMVPPVFRMAPNSGQSVRFIYSGASLPEDRESVFYLDFTQLPALKNSDKNQNQLIVAIRNRVKVFYRPASLTAAQSDAWKELVFSVKNGRLNIENPTGFHITVRRAELKTDGEFIRLAESVMLLPKSNMQWPLPKKVTALRNAQIKLLLVNDYGVDIQREKSL